MDEDIIALLRLFQDRVPDKGTHSAVLALASDSRKWRSAHSLFDSIRNRTLAAANAKDYIRECQYCFAEVCVKSLYNETGPNNPFDSDTPYWIAKNAFTLARAAGVPIEAVAEIMSPPATKS